MFYFNKYFFLSSSLTTLLFSLYLLSCKFKETKIYVKFAIIHEMHCFFEEKQVSGSRNFFEENCSFLLGFRSCWLELDFWLKFVEKFWKWRPNIDHFCMEVTTSNGGDNPPPLGQMSLPCKMINVRTPSLILKHFLVQFEANWD